MAQIALDRKLGRFEDVADVVRVPQLAADCGTDPAGYLTEAQAISAFALSAGVVHHTYSTYARGAEIVMGFYPLLDRSPLGRNEGGSEIWLRRHDEY